MEDGEESEYEETDMPNAARKCDASSLVYGSPTPGMLVRQKDVSCPYCSCCLVPAQAQQGHLCTVCDPAVVGSDASGFFLFLICS